MCQWRDGTHSVQSTFIKQVVGPRWLEGDTPFLSGHHLQLVGPWDLRGTSRNLVLFEALHRRMDYTYLLVTEASET